MSKVIRDLLIPDHLKYNALYPLRIIGLNQDRKADRSGMIGLTFMFAKSITETYKFREDSDSSYSIYGTTLGKFLTNGGSLADSVKNKIANAKKVQLDTKSSISEWDTKCFLLSVNELGYSPSGSIRDSVLLVGKNGGEMYLNFAVGGLTANNTPPTQSVLSSLGIKDTYLRDLGTASQITGLYCAYVQFGGNFTESYLDVPRTIVPCFCL